MLTIKHIDKLANGASAGPWQRRGGNIYAGNDKVAECPPCQGHRGERNAKYMAAMDPDTARQLIRERDQLREALEGVYPLAVAWMGYYAGAYTENGEDHPFHSAAIDKARAALKATDD